MSIITSLSSDGLEMYTAPTLKELCLYKCVTTKEILTTEVEVDEKMDGSKKLDWEKFRLKEPIQRELVEALLEAGDKHMFQLTSKYEPILAAIRMSQPEHLVKVHVSNTKTLTDFQLEWLISGGNVKSLDIHGCESLRLSSFYSINKFGNKLEYLRFGDSYQVLPIGLFPSSSILRTPNLKTFIVFKFSCGHTSYWRNLLHDFIRNVEELGISICGRFETLEFLEPAKNTLSSLTLADCDFNQDANAWAFLYKLNNLRSLDLLGSSIAEAFVGENVVERILTAMPNLSRLAVDPGFVKDISMETSSRGQGSVAKRLEFLGIMDDDDVAELRKAKLLANEVAYFGTVEGELRILEFYSNRLVNFYWDSKLERLLKSLSEKTTAPSCETVAVTVISSLIKIFKNTAVDVLKPDVTIAFLTILRNLLTTGVAPKLGNVLLDQCTEAFVCFLRESWFHTEEDVAVLNGVVDIMVILDRKLCLGHYETVVPMVMRMAKYILDFIDVVDCKELCKKIAQLLEQTVDRFPEETDALWGISSVLFLIEESKNEMVSEEDERHDVLKIFSNMIASVSKLCLNSVPSRAAFHSANGVGIVMNLLKEIFDGCLGFADRDSLALLAILKSILEDTNLELSESGMMSSGLEKLFLSVNSQLEFCKSPDSEKETTHYSQLKGIAELLNFMESDPRYDYKASAAVKEIVMKLK